jgi:hypothetical protein
MKFILARRSTTLWTRCVDFVRDRYAKAFEAEINPSPDAFVACYSGTAVIEGISACAGVTFGCDKPFFSEQYLDEKIDVLVEREFGGRPERRRLIEIGALASRHDGSGKEIIQLLPVMTWCLGMQYVLCTATGQLCKLFQDLKVPFMPLQAASQDRLPEAERERWGRYYSTGPVVGVVPLNRIAELFTSATGRYAFAAPEITLLDKRTPCPIKQARE